MGRKRLRGSIAGIAALTLAATAACGGAGAAGGGAGGDSVITYGYWQSGVPAVTTLPIIHLARQTGPNSDLDVKMKPYSNLEALYADLATGRVDAVSAGPATAASMVAQGSRIGVAGVTARSTAVLVSKDKKFTAEALRGSRIAAPTSTSTWQLVKLQIRDKFGLKAHEDYTVVSAHGLSGPFNQVAAGTADYGMSWGDAIPEALAQFPEVEVVATPEELAGQGDKPFWQFTVTVYRGAVTQEQADKLIAGIADSVDWLHNHPEKAAKMVREAGASAELAQTYQEYVAAGNSSNFNVTRMNDEVCTTLMNQFKRLKKAGALEEVPKRSSYCFYQS